MDRDDMKTTVPGVGPNCTARILFRPESTIELDVVATRDGERIVPVFTKANPARPELRAVARFPEKPRSDDEPTVVVSGRLADSGMTRTIPDWQFRGDGDETRLAVGRLRGSLRQSAAVRWAVALGAGVAAMSLATVLATTSAGAIGRSRAAVAGTGFHTSQRVAAVEPTAVATAERERTPTAEASEDSAPSFAHVDAVEPTDAQLQAGSHAAAVASSPDDSRRGARRAARHSSIHRKPCAARAALTTASAAPAPSPSVPARAQYDDRAGF